VLLTPPGSELQLLPEVDVPPGAIWRLVENLGTGCFVALASADTFSNPEPRTLIMCWDSDLVHFLNSKLMSTKLYALHHVKRSVVDGRPVQQVREITEIWHGVDTSALDFPVFVFYASDGSSFCGFDATAVPEFVRVDARIAVIPSPSPLN
jgi:hypothetical protein